MQTDRVGHLAYNTKIFIHKLLLNQTKNKSFLVVISGDSIANYSLLNLWKQKLKEMYKDKVFFVENSIICKILNVLQITNTTEYFENVYHSFNTDYHKIPNKGIIVHLTPADEKKGRQILESMGVDSWFICFHARDLVYGTELTNKLGSAYHDHRNCDISNYVKAAEYITSCGGYALRMGYGVEKRLAISNNNRRIIDYASDYRSDFGDLYVSSKAKFYLGCASGAFDIAATFGVPVAVANIVPIEFLTGFKEGDLFIPKKVWSNEKKRLLTFRECFELGMKRYKFIREDSPTGIEVIENSPEEILDLAQEMNERLDGRYEYSGEDEELQNRYHSIIKPHHFCYGTPIRIGTKFLRANKELLE